MSSFDTRYFQKFPFNQGQIERYFRNALRDLRIAQKDEFAEVRFTYGYQALIKAGIALIAKVGQVRVRSKPGHHVKILEKTSEILENPDILEIGDKMRIKRNDDFYGGGESIGPKEAEDYLRFVERVVEIVQEKLKGN